MYCVLTSCQYFRKKADNFAEEKFSKKVGIDQFRLQAIFRLIIVGSNAVPTRYVGKYSVIGNMV